MAEKRISVSREDFIRVALTSNTVGEVAEKTGLKVASVKARLAAYNKILVDGGEEPITLESGQRGRAKLTLAELKAMRDSIASEVATVEVE